MKTASSERLLGLEEIRKMWSRQLGREVDADQARLYTERVIQFLKILIKIERNAS